MKLLQLNAWGGRLEKQVEKLLVDQAADIVCLQEIISTEGDGALSIPLEHLKASCDYANSYMSPVFSFRLMNNVASFGNAILSRQPFASTQTIFTNLEYKEDFDFDSNDYNIRNLQHVEIELGGTRVHILNHHGHHVRQHKNGDEQTLRQMRVISEYLDTLSGPVILTGDFNLAPESESLELINKRLKNLSVEFGLNTTRTPLTHKTEVCDYVFVSKDIRVQQFEALNDLVSDHKALVLEFDL